jgi:hypothetical protein
VKLGEEFNGLIIIDDQVDTVMEDVVADREEEKADKVVDSKYLQPRWCPLGLTHTQKQKLQWLWLAEMREKEWEKRRDELFHRIKPMTLPKKEWRRKEGPQCSMAELDANGQTVMPGSQTVAGTVPGGQTVSFGDQTTQEVRGSAKDEVAEPSSPHTEAAGHTAGPGGPTANSCRVDANSGANEISSPIDMEEDANDDLLDYKPSPVRDSMEINVIYISSTD